MDQSSPGKWCVNQYTCFEDRYAKIFTNKNVWKKKKNVWPKMSGDSTQWEQQIA